MVDCQYHLYEIDRIEDIHEVLKNEENLQGLNVTIPYKQEIIPFLDDLDENARKIGAVNVIKIKSNRRLIGYNSDYYGFISVLVEWIGKFDLKRMKALVLGTGGTSRAVCTALQDLGVEYNLVSRSNKGATWLYSDLTRDVISTHRLIINTTPLGMHPNVDGKPDIPYQLLTKIHFLFDPLLPLPKPPVYAAFSHRWLKNPVLLSFLSSIPDGGGFDREFHRLSSYLYPPSIFDPSILV